MPPTSPPAFDWKLRLERHASGGVTAWAPPRKWRHSLGLDRSLAPPARYHCMGTCLGTREIELLCDCQDDSYDQMVIGVDFAADAGKESFCTSQVIHRHVVCMRCGHEVIALRLLRQPVVE